MNRTILAISAAAASIAIGMAGPAGAQTHRQDHRQDNRQDNRQGGAHRTAASSGVRTQDRSGYNRSRPTPPAFEPGICNGQRASHIGADISRQARERRITQRTADYLNGFLQSSEQMARRNCTSDRSWQAKQTNERFDHLESVIAQNQARPPRR